MKTREGHNTGPWWNRKLKAVFTIVRAVPQTLNDQAKQLSLCHIRLLAKLYCHFRHLKWRKYMFWMGSDFCLRKLSGTSRMQGSSRGQWFLVWCPARVREEQKIPMGENSHARRYKLVWTPAPNNNHSLGISAKNNLLILFQCNYFVCICEM